MKNNCKMLFCTLANTKLFVVFKRVTLDIFLTIILMPIVSSMKIWKFSKVVFLDKNVHYSRTHCNSKNETHINWSFSKNWKFFGWIHHYINCWSHLNGITQYYNQKADSGICSVHWPCMHYAVHCNAKSSQNAMLTWTTNEIRNPCNCRMGTFPLLTNFEKSLIWNDIFHPSCWWKCFDNVEST